MSSKFEKFKIILTKKKLTNDERYCLNYSSGKNHIKFFECYNKIQKLNKFKELQSKYIKENKKPYFKN